MFGHLDKNEIERLIHQQVVGRIGCNAEGITYIVPISYAYDGEYVYARTFEGMKMEIMRYFGTMNLGEDTSWIESYIDRMMKDEKQVDSSYRRLITDKLFNWIEEQVKAKEKTVTPEELTAMQHHHEH